MSSPARSSREEERRLSIRTLTLASIGSAVAAIVTSQFWVAGTPVAAALTPVIVALVSELLRHPTERIASRITRETDALPEAAGAAPPPRVEEHRPQPVREEPVAGPREHVPRRPPPRGAPRTEPEFKVYRAGRSRRRRSVPWGPILATAAIAFAIAIAVLTISDMIAGESLGGNGRDTTLFGGGRDDGPAPEPQPTVPEQTQPAEPPPEPDRTAPQAPPEETTPTQTQTAPAPAPQPRTTPPSQP